MAGELTFRDEAAALYDQAFAHVTAYFMPFLLRAAGVVTIVIAPPRNADRLQKNPLGIYITAINWSKELG
jgi:type IV secretory pathway TrbF-like protein